QVEERPRTGESEAEPPPPRPRPEWGQELVGQLRVGLLALELTQLFDRYSLPPSHRSPRLQPGHLVDDLRQVPRPRFGTQLVQDRVEPGLAAALRDLGLRVSQRAEDDRPCRARLLAGGHHLVPPEL